MIENQIPSYDILRKSYESRYYVVDSNMKGYFRFAYGISNDEAILKDGTTVKCAEKVLAGTNEIKLDNILIGAANNSYLLIKDKFYLINEVSDKAIIIYDFFNEDIEEGTIVKLFSSYIEVSTDNVCTKFGFHIGDVLKLGNNSYVVSTNDTPESVEKELSKWTLINRKGETFYAACEVISDYEYETYSSYPVESGFLDVSSEYFIVPGDSFVLFNEDVRANNTVYVTMVKDIKCASGFKYSVLVSELSGIFKYGQLKAFPAYRSKKCNIHKCKPSIIDICGDTVYGKDVNIVKGIKLYNQYEEITNGYENLKYVAGFELEPSDLWLSDVITGRVYPKLPNICCVTDEDGIFKMYVDSKIDAEFTMKFEATGIEAKISVTDIDGNILALGNLGDIISSRLNKVVVNIKSSANTDIDMTTFKYIGDSVHFIEYYFVCQEMSNERIEVNSLHLNPVFKNYKELLAVIGRDKAGEGRIAL